MDSLAALRSSRVMLPSGLAPATVCFEGGRISEVRREALAHAAPSDRPGLLDVGDLLVFPGLVDCHVHINEPGRTEWEGFETATRAAAAGGVTTLIDMPLNSLPVTTHQAALETKIRASEGKRFVDVGFWGGVVPGNASELPGLADGGVLGCKAFLVHSGIDEFPNATVTDLRRAMPVLRDRGLPLLVHAELDLGAPSNLQPPQSYQSFLASRPKAWEDAAIQLLVELCRETRCAVHIVHLSSAASLPILQAAKAEGLPITVETCPHYLCLEAEAIPAGATHYKCAPPIREHENRELLWRGLLDGSIDFVITDHSPCLPALKLPELGDFHQAWGGIASLQLGLSAVWTEARQRGARLDQLAQWLSAGPAAFAGLGQRKGRIAPGYDADFVVWDPRATRPVLAEELFFKHKVSPYLGRELAGRVTHTLLAGELVFEDGVHRGAPRGQLRLHRG
ncbi:MAG TPA: allantoinase AllB [Polyangiaceae bacterium]